MEHATRRSDAEALFAGAYTDLVSVIPPGAQLVPSSKIPQAGIGKIPGRRQANGLWAGYNWRLHEPTLDDVRKWAVDGANIGLRADRFPGVDIDCTDEALARIIQDFALARLGHAPIRTGKAPKRLLMYRTDDPFGRMRLWITKAGGEHHLVEILGMGQQYLVHGTHPGTMQPYRWNVALELMTVPTLIAITRTQADEFLTELAAMLDMLFSGISTKREGDGKPITRTASSDQSGLLAPSAELLREAVELIPNNNDLFPTRQDYLRMGYAVKAAAGSEHEEEGWALFADWAMKWEGNGRSAPDAAVIHDDYRRMNGDKSVGWNWIAEQARPFGFNDAQLDFDCVAPEPAPDWLSEFNAQYAIVRSIPNALLYTPAVGEVDFMNQRHWTTVTANQLVTVGGAGGSLRQVAKSALWLKHPARREYKRVVIDPRSAPLSSVPAPGGGEDFNLWPGLALDPSMEGSCDLFNAHILDIVCSSDRAAYDWVMMWLAAMVQDPARLPGTALVLKGRQGCGKSVVGEIVGHMLGPALAVTVSGVEELTGRFNSRLQNKVLVQAEEAFYAGDPKARGKLKTIITGPTINIEKKGLEPISVANLAHVLITSNEQWVVDADANGERRMMVLEVSPARAHDLAYFGALRRQMLDNDGGCARLLHHLLHEIVVDWDLIRRPIATSALLDQQLQSLPADRQWWLEVLQDGSLPNDAEGAGTCSVDDLYAQYQHFMVSRLAGRRGSKNAFGTMLAAYRERRVQRRTMGLRRWEYDFKALAECRAIFARGLAAAPDWGEQTTWEPQFDGIS